jgi:alpha-ketoglutaric semialdehyde dehydrogenase
MKILGKSIIGLETGNTFTKAFKTFNSSTNSENDFLIFEASDIDLELALSKADSCFLAFASLPSLRRAEFLLKIAEKLDENRQILKEYYCLESSLTESRSEVELNRTIHQLKEFATLITDNNWGFCSEEAEDLRRIPNPKYSLKKYFLPLGPVVVFGASNFPFAYSTVGGDTASALAAGCPVIVKSHAMHAGTGDLVAQLVIEAAKICDIPDGVFSNLNAVGIELGQKLILDKRIKAIGFTGSLRGGMSIFRLAQNRPEPIPVFAEMGSVNPLFLFESAFEENQHLVQLISNSISLGAGQFCTNPGLIFLVKSENSKLFINHLFASLEKVEEQAMLHPNIFANYQHNKNKITSKKEVSALVDGESSKINHIKPVLCKISSKNFLKNEDFQEEVFGSFTLIVELENDQEFVQIAKVMKGQLTGSVFMSEVEFESNNLFINSLQQKVGRLNFNSVPTGVEVCQAMNHGGPFPATSDSRFTAVGKDAILRFLRPITYQNFSQNSIKKLRT